jgi:hypothetical protein
VASFLGRGSPEQAARRRQVPSRIMLKTWLCGEPPGNPVRTNAFVVAIPSTSCRHSNSETAASCPLSRKPAPPQLPPEAWRTGWHRPMSASSRVRGRAIPISATGDRRRSWFELGDPRRVRSGRRRGVARAATLHPGTGTIFVSLWSESARQYCNKFKQSERLVSLGRWRKR